MKGWVTGLTIVGGVLSGEYQESCGCHLDLRDSVHDHSGLESGNFTISLNENANVESYLWLQVIALTDLSQKSWHRCAWTVDDTSLVTTALPIPSWRPFGVVMRSQVDVRTTPESRSLGCGILRTYYGPCNPISRPSCTSLAGKDGGNECMDPENDETCRAQDFVGDQAVSSATDHWYVPLDRSYPRESIEWFRGFPEAFLTYIYPGVSFLDCWLEDCASELYACSRSAACRSHWNQSTSFNSVCKNLPAGSAMSNMWRCHLKKCACSVPALPKGVAPLARFPDVFSPLELQTIKRSFDTGTCTWILTAHAFDDPNTAHK